MRGLTATAALLAALLPSAGHSQYMSMFNAANQAAVNYAGTVSINAAIGNSAALASKRAKRKKATQGAKWLTKSAPRAPYRPITYSQEPTIRAAVVASHVARARRLNEADGARLERLFQERDLFAEFAHNARAYGLDVHDLGDVLTAYWAVSWGAVHRVGRVDKPRVQALRAQLRATLAGTRLVKLTSETQRQQIADDMMVKLILVDGALEHSLQRGDKAALKRLAKAVRQAILTTMGVDLATLDLTQKGLVRAR